MELENSLNTDPRVLFKFEKSFKTSKICCNCFLKGCKWSPDGLCLLAASDDFHLRLFEVPEAAENAEDGGDRDPVLDYKEGGTVYDYAWYPKMTSADPSSCVFASSSRDSPIHLWDAYTGGLRATYQPINQYDEVHAANSLCFSPSGKVYCGFKKEIKIFDLSLPGRESEKISLKNSYQSGIISCITFNPSVPALYALGSYDKSIGLYTEPDGEAQCVLQAHKGGVTHLMFSPDGVRLYSGGRQDSELFCWDLRNPGSMLFTIQRVVNTCQRIYFDLTPDGRYLYTGNTNGRIDVYDTSLAPGESGYLNKLQSWQAHLDACNGISLHPMGSKLASASGQHHVPDFHWSSDEDDVSGDDDVIENSVKVWQLPCR